MTERRSSEPLGAAAPRPGAFAAAAAGEPTAGEPTAGEATGRGSTQPEEAFGAALANLPGMGPVRLAAILRHRSPAAAWAVVRAGAPGPLAAVWRERSRSYDVEAGWAVLQAAGVATYVQGRPGYPPELAADHEAPGVLFSRGDVARLAGRRVAVIGARNCTRYGRDVAFELGRDLAANGVVVVSGLALGVDGAAHEGALAAACAPPVAVVGSGLDVVYPRRHARLWEQVGAAGALLSEAPLGAVPEPWRFPARNRIIAALAEVVVVVESRHQGGSRHTVEAAIGRGRPVMAVPGPVRSATSDLPNALLAEGCHPARDALDVLVALGLSPSTAVAPPSHDRPPPDPADAAVLEGVGWRPATFEQIVVATGRTPATVGVALAHLERDGWVAGRGGWWERVATTPITR